MLLKQSIFSKSYFRYALILIVITIGILVWVSYARLQAFHDYHQDLTHETVLGIEKLVSQFIAEKTRMVNVFADEQIDLIRALASNPDNDELRNKLGELITLYFPDRFAFSIADSSGEPMFEDFDGLISDLCLTDIKKFTKDKFYLPYVHPNTEGYHFDVMVPYGENGEEGVLFISFLADVLGDIIKSIQSPGHQVMLIYPQRNNLIEIIADGARNHWVRDDYRLSEKELADINMRHAVTGTRWEAISFHNDDLENNFMRTLILESFLTLSLFIFVALFMVIRLRKEEVRRELAERQKNELMSVVSHEFRSPASVIQSALDLVKDGDAGEINADVKKYINMALASTSQLMLLVNDFLDIQKLESGNLQFNMRDLPLFTIVVNVVESNMMYASKVGATYKLMDPLCSDVVNCDENRIGQVLTNLLSNAAKYGGKDDVIEVSLSNHEKYARVCVTDHGSGIPIDFKAASSRCLRWLIPSQPLKK